MSEKKRQRPEWAPPGASSAFTTEVVPGRAPTPQTEGDSDSPRRADLSLDDYVAGVRSGDRVTLARTITLVESNALHHQELAQEVLSQLLPESGRSVRVGITGVPGSGKSTFIEAFGTYLCDTGHKVAVLAVDPSSTRTGGSILGDKTRMEALARHPNSFIRPSPSGGVLGGVSRKTRETLCVCEAAGFDVILVETVGVGQSEVTVRSMVDFFLLLTVTGTGDDLQTIKKGVIEIADAILVTKADRDNLTAATRTASELTTALHYLSAATPSWETKAMTCSALEKTGIEETWELIQTFVTETKESGVFDSRRQEQLLEWVDAMVFENLRSRFYQGVARQDRYEEIRQAVATGKLPAATGARELIELFERAKPATSPSRQ